MKGVFITGTDTDIGKTVVAAWLMRHWNWNYWKPVQSGTIDATDPDTMASLTGFDEARILPATYTLSKPLSPHASAAIDGVKIELERFHPPASDRPLVVEGAGGVLVPLNDKDMVIDLMARLALPTIVVARSGLGTINHTCLTLEALRRHYIRIAGVIMVGEANPGNKQAIEHYGQTKVIAEIPVLDKVDAPSILSLTPPPPPESVL